MSVNNDTSIPIENLFHDRDSLKNAGLNKNETAVLSNCNYRNFAEKWGKSLGNISSNAHEHIVNGRKVEEGFLRRIGTWTGFISYEPWKEAEQIFSDWESFNSYVRFKIPPETYQKIAKANPQYFDKVIEHLNSVADELDKRADVRIGTFVSNQSGQTLTVLAEDFRSTANFLKLKMKGEDAAKPENNNANPGTDRGQPTIINHYHNNIQFGNNYNNYGHIGNNNFYNKGGNMAVMFKESSNSVPNTGFRPEYSVSKSEHSFYSPTINGIKLLDVTTENALKLFGQDKSEENENDAGRVNAGIHKKTDNDEQNVEEYDTTRNLHSEKNVQQKPTKTSETLLKKNLNSLKQIKEEEVNNQPPVPPTTEDFTTRLRNLYTKFFANWDTIREEIKKQDNTLQAQSNQGSKSINNLQQIYESHPMAKSVKITPANILRELKSLNMEVNNFVPQGNGIEKEAKYDAKEMLLKIEKVMSNDKQTSENRIKSERAKNKGSTHDNAPQDHGILSSFTDKKHIDDAKIRYKENGSLEGLLKETWEIIQDIRSELEKKKKITNPPTTKTKSPSKPQSDVKGINVQQKNDQLSSLERMKQFSEGTKIQNKNLKKRVETKVEPKRPSGQDKMKEFNKNIVSKKFENMKTDNVFDASKNNWNTTNKFQTDASGNNGITHNSKIQEQLNQLKDPLKKF